METVLKWDPVATYMAILLDFQAGYFSVCFSFGFFGLYGTITKFNQQGWSDQHAVRQQDILALA